MARKSLHEVAVLLHESDDVIVLKKPVKPGDELVDGSITLQIQHTVGPGHKIALRGLAPGQPVRKYGQTIGAAQRPIAAGEHVHTHNLELKDFGRDYQFCSAA